MRENQTVTEVLLRPFKVGGGGEMQKLGAEALPGRNGRGGAVAAVGVAEQFHDRHAAGEDFAVPGHEIRFTQVQLQSGRGQ